MLRIRDNNLIFCIFISILYILGSNIYNSVALPYNATIIGNYADYVMNPNTLTINVEVHVYDPGEYSLCGSLCDENNSEIAWTIDHQNFSRGYHIMHLNFDINAINNEVNGPLHLSNLKLTSGSSDSRLDVCDFLPRLYYPISSYLTNHTKQNTTEKQLIGIGNGEILLKYTFQVIAQVFSGDYSYDIPDVPIPPISTQFNITSSNEGYTYSLPGIYVPAKPNDIIVRADGVKTLNIGLRKSQGSYENSSNVWKEKQTRIWITSQVMANVNGIATAESDLLSPGRYHVKIFGNAAENASYVSLTMTMIKKIIVKGPFSLSLNTTGFPSGNYSITANALNGTFGLDELEIRGSINV